MQEAALAASIAHEAKQSVAQLRLKAAAFGLDIYDVREALPRNGLLWEPADD